MRDFYDWATLMCKSYKKACWFFDIFKDRASINWKMLKIGCL